MMPDQKNEPDLPSISKTVNDYQNGLTSCSEQVFGFLERIEKRKELNAFITVCKETALRDALHSDERLKTRKSRPLEGIPIAVKDNYCTEGVLTTAGSKMLGNFIPTYESEVTARLRNAGAVIIGKTNMDEFAMGSSTETSFFGPTKNPAAISAGFPNLVPGGSSGGSAAAVSANLALAALGTDTGGSIRQPASYCGVVGFKPTYGVCSRWGIVSYASSLDQAGVFCNSVSDVGLLMDVIAGHDPKDSTSIPNQSYGFGRALSTPPKKMRIGLPIQAIKAGCTEDASIVWDAARKICAFLDADLIEVDIPRFANSLSAYYVIALSEASSNLARYDGVRYGFRAEDVTSINELYEKTRSEGFGEEVQRRIMLGAFALSAGFYEAYYNKARKIRTLLSEDFRKSFRSIDFLMMPTTPSAAFELGSMTKDPVKMYLEDIFTVPINMAGLPAISIPVTANKDGLPLGLQIVGPQLSDQDLIRFSASVEIATSMVGLH